MAPPIYHIILLCIYPLPLLMHLHIIFHNSIHLFKPFLLFLLIYSEEKVHLVDYWGLPVAMLGNFRLRFYSRSFS